jgi:hypothetical protein
MMPVSPRETERGRECRQQASVVAVTLDSRIPKLSVSGRPKGVELLLDGKAVSAAEPAAWQGVNPRLPHTLLVRTEDRTCSTITVTLTEGEVRTIDLHDVAFSCRLEPAPSDVRSVPPVRPPPGGSGEPSATPGPPAERTTSPLKWMGLAVGGLGVVGVGVGGFLALSAKSDYESVSCVNNVCPQPAYQVRVDARTKADWATGTIVVGGVAAVGGLLLWLLAPEGGGNQSSDSTRVQLALGLGTVGLTVRLR